MKRRLPKEPSAIAMILTAVTGTVLGVLLGCVILLQEPPARAKATLSSDGQSGRRMGDYTASFSLGSVATEESATMRSRMSRFSRKIPGPLAFTEMEVNHYLSQFKMADAKQGEELSLSFSAPNVRLEQDSFVLHTKVVINPKSDRFELLVQVAGRIENGDEGVFLKVDRLLLNSLEIPSFGGYAENFFYASGASISLPADIMEAWNAVRDVQLEQDKVVLVL